MLHHPVAQGLYFPYVVLVMHLGDLGTKDVIVLHRGEC